VVVVVQDQLELVETIMVMGVEMVEVELLLLEEMALAAAALAVIQEMVVVPMVEMLLVVVVALDLRGHMEIVLILNLDLAAEVE